MNSISRPRRQLVYINSEVVGVRNLISGCGKALEIIQKKKRALDLEEEDRRMATEVCNARDTVGAVGVVDRNNYVGNGHSNNNGATNLVPFINLDQ